MVHFFALLFWVAGALAFIAGLPQLGVAVFFVIVLNGLFAFVQEQRAEHATERLRDLLPRRATVVRDGRSVEIAAEELVVGDVVLLAEGDRVSADLRLDVVHALALDTSSLTGESVSAHPALGDVVNVGCFVVEGEARATVCRNRCFKPALPGSRGSRAGNGPRPRRCIVSSPVCRGSSPRSRSVSV